MHVLLHTDIMDFVLSNIAYAWRKGGAGKRGGKGYEGREGGFIFL